MSEKKEIKACIRCGSKDISWASKSGAGESGMRFMGVEEESASIAYKCNNCGYTGNPVIFDSEKDRLRFVELKKKEEQKKENGRR